MDGAGIMQVEHTADCFGGAVKTVKKHYQTFSSYSSHTIHIRNTVITGTPPKNEIRWENFQPLYGYILNTIQHK